MTVLDILARLADEPDATALIRHRKGSARTTSRHDLLGASHTVAHVLRDAGVRTGHKAVVMTRDAHDLSVVTYALITLGAVPVLIEPRAAVGRCLQDVAPDLFIGEPLAHLGRRLLGWGRPRVRTALVTGATWMPSGKRLVTGTPAAHGPWPPLREPDADDLAVIAFTSGSTGRPRGAEYRHATLAGQLDALTTLLSPRPDDVLLAGFLPIAILGPLLGPATVVPAVNHLAPARTPPEELVEPVLKHAVTTVLASPAVLGLLAGHCARHGVALPSVWRILSFGAPLRTRLADALRRAEFAQHLLRAVGVSARWCAVPPRLARAASTLSDIALRLTGSSRTHVLSRFLVEELLQPHHFDLGAARRELGFEPPVGLDAGLAELSRSALTSPGRQQG
ncbi:AMP-binding protein [Streptomyces sp. NPDC005876]|uniref:AMP-binding protein n=1 Tax=Streptomyces sp. NPDC005876 TaxID=3157076 RepID=UPI0033CC52D5